jgi:hypothetical protein
MLSWCFATCFTPVNTLGCNISSSPSSIPHRTSAAPTVHRRQPPSLPLNPNLVLLEHRHDPLVLSSPINFTLSHPSFIFHSSDQPKFRRRLLLTVDSPLRALSHHNNPLASTTLTP